MTPSEQSTTPTGPGMGALCGHDSWQVGCPNCEYQHRLALEWMGEHLDPHDVIEEEDSRS